MGKQRVEEKMAWVSPLAGTWGGQVTAGEAEQGKVRGTERPT